MVIAALTGNYGAGKSLALGFFEKLGAHILNTDRIVSELLESPDVVDRVKGLLGDTVINAKGKLIRQRVAEIVFNDKQLRRSLEDILHPLVFQTVDEVAAESEREVVVVEAAIIFERGHEGRFQKTIVVITDEESALQRLVSSGVPKEMVQLRLRAQMPASEKAARADYVIDNSGTFDETRRQVEQVYKELCAQ